MPIRIKNPETEALDRRLAELCGESITGAVRQAVAERLERMERQSRSASRIEKLLEISQCCANRPVLNQLTEDEILGFDAWGIPAH